MECIESTETMDLVESFHKRGYNLTSSINSITDTLESVTDSSSLSSSDHSSSNTASSSGSHDDDHARLTEGNILKLRDPKHGQTAIHLAVRKGDDQVLRVLAKSSSTRALINVQDNNGNTALHFAVARYNGDADATRLLLEAGASVRKKNQAGLSPIGAHLLTLKHDRVKLVEMLLHHGADPNAMVHGASLLHYAVKNRFVAIATCLVQWGANISTTDDHEIGRAHV